MKLIAKRTIRSGPDTGRKRQHVWFNNTGGVGPGFIFTILTLMVLIGGALMMIDNLVPEDQGASAFEQKVIIITPTGEAARQNLQLYTFPGETLTPTFSPTPTFAPTQYPQPGGNDKSNTKNNANNNNSNNGPLPLPDNNGGSGNSGGGSGNSGNQPIGNPS
jgi:hypothetical protein